MSKYKYYFRKPKSEIAKDILKGIALSGAICFAATSPYFVSNLLKNVKQWRRHDKKKFYNNFYRLRRDGCINCEIANHQIYISLTEEGKKKAGRLQIDALKIEKPKKWDGKWRIIIFDIAQLKKLSREAFRGKLKQIGFYPLQKSVWAHPFDCRDEIEVLKEFFGLKDKEARLIVAENIGEDNFLKRIFKIVK